GLEAHHVRPWLYGGPTIMANLVLLCARHHHAIHDDAFHIAPLGHGRFRFLRADGPELPRAVDPSELATTTGLIEDDHAHVAPDAATTHWDGTRLDRHYAVAVLAQELRPSA
ncbi:MAG TPA: HNH endonuclease signature motif containing protein, partial [Jatrophihabitans sp.]|nr:HNH endonuclease signature motif containing protein [Jatrophihabitans sp.]